MANKPPLTEKKRRWVGKRDVTLRGQQLNYNASQQARYKRALMELVQQMTEETKTKVIRLFNSSTAQEFHEQQQEAEAMDASVASMARKLMNQLLGKFTALFASKAATIAENMVAGASQTSATTLHTSLKQLSGGLSLKTSVVPEGMEDVSKALITENVNLIKSIPQQYLKDVSTQVYNSITFGRGIADLVPAIQKAAGVVSRRTRNIALDQTRKAYNSINKQRMQSIGVKQFEWRHSGGGHHPRPSHQKMHGVIFDFDRLESQQAALGVPDDDRGIPGQAINCRCTMTPVLNFEDE